jgi:hypothetical protein
VATVGAIHRIFVCSVLVAVICLLASSADADCNPVAQGDEAARAALTSQLRDGGYVIAFRHADKDPNGEDALTTEGQDQARRIGQSFKALGIPVNRVIHSPRHRTTQTAELAFGPGESDPDLARPGGLDRLLDSLQDPARREDLLGSGNLVVVTHSDVLESESQGNKVACSEGLVLVPSRPRGDRCVARALPLEWSGEEGAMPRWSLPSCAGEER